MSRPTHREGQSNNTPAIGSPAQPEAPEATMDRVGCPPPSDPAMPAAQKLETVPSDQQYPRDRLQFPNARTNSANRESPTSSAVARSVVSTLDPARWAEIEPLKRRGQNLIYPLELTSLKNSRFVIQFQWSRFRIVFSIYTNINQDRSSGVQIKRVQKRA